jgi:hypothetical protein
MHAPKQLKRLSYLLVLVCLLLNACVTLDYRGVQAQFEQAVLLDNGRSTSAFTESPVFTESGYADVVVQLTPEYIKELDERLRPNAYLLLSVSQWRMGLLDKARESAKLGLEQKSLINQSRDHVLLMMIPGLVIDSEIEQKWLKAGKKFDAEKYREAEKDFITAFDKIKEAEQAMGPATPMSTHYYLNTQRFRVIENWRSIINSLVLSTGDFDTIGQEAAIARAEAYFGGKALGDVSKGWKNSVPVGHPLRQWMEDQSK